MEPVDHLSIGFIGAGKVGVSLGAYFKSKGLNVAGYASRNPESAMKAAEIIFTSCFTLKGLVARCNMIWIATPDDQIEKVWDELVRHELQGKIICHTSGARDSSVFTGIATKGAFGYSVHPMHAFADKNGSIEGLGTTCFTLEGDPAYLQQFQQLFTGMGNPSFVIDRQDKPIYHLANVMVTNLIVALLSMGSDYLAKCGSFGGQPLTALLPMIENNLKNVKQNGLIHALTGPVERNDRRTVGKHLKVIAPSDARLYQELSQRLVELAEKKHPERDYTGMRQTLATGKSDD